MSLVSGSITIYVRIQVDVFPARAGNKHTQRVHIYGQKWYSNNAITAKYQREQCTLA